MYMIVLKLQVLMINQNLCKSLARINGNEILIRIWNNPDTLMYYILDIEHNKEYITQKTLK